MSLSFGKVDKFPGTFTIIRYTIITDPCQIISLRVKLMDVFFVILPNHHMVSVRTKSDNSGNSYNALVVNTSYATVVNVRYERIAQYM